MKGFKKGILKRVTAVVLSGFIVFGTVYSDYETAQAAEIVEAIYYTYWDLITSLYAACGYSTTIDPSALKSASSRACTSKQVWGNFCTYLERRAQFNGWVLSSGYEAAISEVKSLAGSKSVTSSGIKVSQGTYDFLRDSLCDTSSSVIKSSYSSSELSQGFHLKNDYTFTSSLDFYKWIYNCFGLDGLKSSSSDQMVFNYRNFSDSEFCKAVLNEGYVISVSSYSYRGCIYYNFYALPSDVFLAGFSRSSSVYIDSWVDGVFTTTNYYKYKKFGLIVNTLNNSVDFRDNDLTYAGESGTETLIFNGSCAFDNFFSAADVSVEACPEEVPEVIPWEKNPAVPDGWRIVDPNEDPGEDPDVIPAYVPITPINPDKDPDSTENPDKDPDSTENPGKDPDSTENPGKDPDSTENPGKDPDSDPDKDKNPATLPGYNPDSGRYIDPSTGWEIDPSTGQLINPETGELVNPETPDIVDQAESAGDITKVFPFCIPWDMMALVESLKADKEAPKFVFKYHFDAINYDFEVSVDMSDYWKYIKIFRWGMTIFFIIALFFLTEKFTTFVHKMGS